MPTFAWFLAKAECIVDHYMSLEAYEQALSKKANNASPEQLQFPIGEAYIPSITTISPTAPTQSTETPKELTLTAHMEEDRFEGDHVLANSILFKTVYSW